jgi:cell division protein ZapE
MDMFFEALTVPLKRRIHFHAFMQEVHAATHVLRQEIEAKQLKIELLPTIARDIASKIRVLCLDELQVTDVADAMILSKLFTSLLAEGVSVVITSNRPPEELYLGGLQREKFMDFVHFVTSRMDVLQLASPHDYRMQQIKAMQAVYMCPLSDKADEALEDMLAQLTHHAELMPMSIELQGRRLYVPRSYGGIAAFHFSDLCEKPLGPADYLAIARRFHTVFISNIPQLGPEKRNEAKRFVTLIDTLYDHRVKLICTAAAQPARLYASGDGSFEFQRLVSRLAEMQSQQYLDIPHIP